MHNNVKVIHLMSGEVLISQVDEGLEATHVLLRDPYVVMLAPGPNGQPTMATMMWTPAALVQDHIIPIFAGSISAMGPASEAALASYNKHFSKIIQPETGLVAPKPSPDGAFDKTIIL